MGIIAIQAECEKGHIREGYSNLVKPFYFFIFWSRATKLSSH